MTDFADLTVYYRGSTYRASVTVTDPDTGLVTTPGSITCGFTDPSGNSVVAAAMVNDSVGVYHYDYLIPANAVQGAWSAVITATSGVLVKITEGEFLVV